MSFWPVATTDPASTLFRDVAPWLGALVILVLLGGVVIVAVRRQLHGQPGSSDVGFTLQDLRDLHASGQLSDEEFQRARAQVIGRLKPEPEDKQAEEPPATPGNPAPDDQ